MLLDWINFSVFLFGLLGLLFGGNYLVKKQWVSAEVVRKILHLCAGLLLFIAPYFFAIRFYPFFIAFVITTINILSMRYDWLKELHEPDKPSWGIIYYPAAFMVLIYFFWEPQPYIVQLSALILGIGDPLAEIVGRQVRFKKTYLLHKSVKTIEGSSVMFLVSFTCIIVAGVFQILPDIPILHLFLLGTIVAFFATLAEALFDEGIDNISVPFIVALFLDFILPDVNLVFDMWVVSISILPFAYLTYRLNFLNQGGAIAAYIMAVILLGMGGWAWLLPLLAFFLLSSILTFLSHYIRRSNGEIIEKMSARDPVQVLANGSPALLVFIFALNNLWPWAYPIFMIAVASAAADTWSTEIGHLFSRDAVFDPFRFKVVRKGMSGGMSLSGTIGGLLGSCVISVLIFYQNDYYVERSLPLFILIAGSGFFGMIADSAIGSMLQGKYECIVCGKNHEKRNHCGQPSRLLKGYRWMTNDFVNLISIFCAIIFGVVAYNLFYKI